MAKNEATTLENTCTYYQQNYIDDFVFTQFLINLAGNLNSDCEILF